MAQIYSVTVYLIGRKRKFYGDNCPAILKDPLISRGCICMDDEVVLLNKGSFIEQYDRRNETHMHAVQGCQELSRQYSF